MDSLRQWLLGIVLTSLAAGLARSLAPSGRQQAAARLAGGLLLTLSILRPVLALSGGWQDLPVEIPQTAAQSEAYRKNQREAFSELIEEKTEAYILDKAEQLGLACGAEVAVELSQSGIPLPDRVTVTGPFSPELSACIEEEVGIPAEKQSWVEEES